MIKLIGAGLIIIGCGGVGFKMAAASLREERYLLQLIQVLDFMECELQYRLTPLPELFKQASQLSKGKLKQLLNKLSQELEAQISPNVEQCMHAALSDYGDLPATSMGILRKFGLSLGRFDLKGQLKGIEDIRQECKQNLQKILKDKDNRLRSYRTLAVCAGVAIAIIFI